MTSLENLKKVKIFHEKSSIGIPDLRTREANKMKKFMSFKHIHRLFITCVFMVVFCTSCKNKEDHVQEKENVVSFSPASEKPCIESSQIIYHRLHHDPLNQNRLKLLSTWICDTKPNNVWFVRVLGSLHIFNVLRADIYFLPDYSSGRLRKGKFTRYDSFDFRDSKKALVEQGYDPNKLPKPEYREYVYVLPKNDTPSPNQLPSSESLLPFTVADGFADQEIVEIIDFVRLQKPMRMILKNVPWDLNDQLPIMRIWKNQGNIIIMTGTQESPLSGSGQRLTIKKTDGGYELISKTSWIS